MVIIGNADSMSRMLENNDGLLFSLIAILREEVTFCAGGSHLLKIFLQKLEKKEKGHLAFVFVPIGLHGLVLIFWCLTVVMSAH